MIFNKKILTRTVLLVSFVSLFTDVASEMLYPVMPVYLRSIGFSVLLIGILEGVAEAVAGLSKGYFGKMSDVWERRVPFVRAGYVMGALSKPLMAVFINPAWIFCVRTMDRFGKGVRTSARDAMLSDETTPEHKGKVFGFHRSMDTVGAAIGPALALLFLGFFPGRYRLMFLLALFPGLVAIVLTFLLKDKKQREANKRVVRAVPDARTVTPARVGFFSYFGYWSKATPGYRLLVAGLLAFTLFNSSDAFLLLALKERHFSDTLMIGTYIFYNLVYALFSYPLGALADRIGLRTMLLAGLTLFAVVYSCIGFTTGLVMTGILFFFYGIYAACTEGISKALLSNMALKSETATAIGFYNSMSSIFALFSSALAGLLWYVAGPGPMFLVSGAGVFLVVAYLAFVFSRPGLKSTTVARAK